MLGGLQLAARAPELTRALLDGFKKHDLLTYASAISFQILTAIIPFLLFVLALAGLWFVGDTFNSKIFAIAGAFCGVVLGMMVTMPLYHYIVPLVKPERR